MRLGSSDKLSLCPPDNSLLCFLWQMFPQIHGIRITLGSIVPDIFLFWVRLCIKIESSWNISYAMTKPCWGMALRMVVNSSNTEFASLPCLSPAEKVVGSLWAKRYHLKSDVIGASPEMCSFGESPKMYRLGESPPRCAGLVRAPRCAVLVRAP